jgi:hypothetical protein
MYSNYYSLKQLIDKEIGGQSSVLNKFPDHIGRPIVQVCAKHLAQYTSSQLPFNMTYKTNPNETTSGLLKESLGATTTASVTTTNIIAESNEKLNIIDLDTIEQVNWTLEVRPYLIDLWLDRTG